MDHVNNCSIMSNITVQLVFYNIQQNLVRRNFAGILISHWSNPRHSTNEKSAILVLRGENEFNLFPLILYLDYFSFSLSFLRIKFLFFSFSSSTSSLEFSSFSFFIVNSCSSSFLASFFL